ncbi:MAG TPA: hypothetical protein EYP59_07375 [Thiotrichaceae bacterium]|nr:hypothetical protein [Thiotrichaceae bacterium]
MRKIFYFILLFMGIYWLDLSVVWANIFEQEYQAPISEGWYGFLQLELLTHFFISLFFATFLGAIIAYHPQSHAKKESLNEVEAPKTFLIYSVIGAVIGTMVVKYGSVIGFIIFGIGGLLRFRTNLGSSKQTGQLILVTLIGLCCGLNLPHVAVITTMFAYGLIHFLEKQDTYKIVIKNLKKEEIQVFVEEAAELYRGILEKQGCHILSERKNFVKFQVSFVFHAPHSVERENLEYLFQNNVPNDLRGAVDWQTN